MTRRTFIIFWVLASAASILVALKGAALIDDQVIQPLPASIVSIDCDPSADECRGGSAGALTGGAVPAEIVAQLDDSEISAAAAAASTEVSSVVTAAGVPGRTSDGNLASPESSSSSAGSSPATTADEAPTPPRSTTTPPTPTSPVATTAASATTQPATTGGSATTPTSSGTTGATTTTRVTTTTRATTTQPTTTQPPATTTAPQQQTKTFQLMGGTISVLFSSAGVDVLWATAAPDFTVEVADQDPGKRVEFRSDTHRSRIDVWWSNGPQWLIRERADNSGGGGEDDDDNVGSTSTTQG